MSRPRMIDRQRVLHAEERGVASKKAEARNQELRLMIQDKSKEFKNTRKS